MKKSRKTKKPLLTEAEKREQVRLALLKKKAFDNKALEIVHRLIEEGVDEQWLINSGNNLNESYWDDAVTERSISLVCGYPLCDDKITTKHKGTYKVCLRDNKVYKMEERNKFCSNFCFKASYFFRDQLDSSPLWLRETEKKTYIVLKQSFSSDKEMPSVEGMVVDFSGPSEAEVKCDVNGNQSEDEFDSDCENNKFQKETVESTVESLMEAIIIKDSEESKCEKNISDAIPTNDDEKDKKPESASNLTPKEDVNNLKMENLCIKAESEKDLPKKRVSFSEKELPKKNVSLPKKRRTLLQTSNPVDVVKAAINDWFSIDTYRCIVGDEYLRKTLVEKGVSEETIVKTVGDPFLKQDMRAKYRALCRKIDLAEVLENAGEESYDVSNDRLPLPNYGDLQKQVATDLLKVSSFFKGKEVYEEDTGKRSVIVEKENTDDDYSEPRLPLVDKYAEVALRRRIVVDKLSRSLLDVLDLLEFPLSKVRTKLKELVHSFYLSKDDVMFRPQEWSLISLVIVKLLSIGNAELSSAFQKPSSQKYLNMLLLSYQLTDSFLEEMALSLTGNIDALLAKMANNTAAIFSA